MKSPLRNIPSLYVIKLSKWFNLVMPVVVLFYQDNGMGMQEIFILKSIYSVAIVVMEVPSGWMADVWGRKKTLLWGSLLGAVGFLVYSGSHLFWQFAIAEIILGIGHSCISGADSAMLYDTLQAEKRETDYLKQESRITSAGNFAEAFAGVAGGLLAAASLRTPFYAQLVVATAAIPAAFLLTEPKTHARHLGISPLHFFRSVGNTLRKNHDLRVAMLFSSVTGTATLTFAWFVQPFLKEIGLPVAWFGLLWTLLNLTVAVSSVVAWKAEAWLGRQKGAFFILVSITLGFILSGLFVAWWGILFLFLFYLFRGIATPVLKNYINEHTDSSMRATLLSMRDFTIRINFALTGPLLGWITDQVSLGWALATAGLLYLLLGSIAVWPWLKRVKR